MTKNLSRSCLVLLLVASGACGGSSKPATDGGGGKSGQTGTAGSSGTTGTAGSTAGSSGSTGTAGSTAGTTGTAGADAAAGTTGTAGADGGAGSTGDASVGDAPVGGDGGPTTTNIKAATGGTVKAGGLTIDIPAGALAADTNITVAISDASTAPSPSTVVSSVYDIGPNGTTFTKPVTLTLAFDAAKLGAKRPVVSYVMGGKWVALGLSQVTSNNASATTTHFTPFGVVAQDSATCQAQATKAECQTCCGQTYDKDAPLYYAVQKCACTAGSPCETACKTSACMQMAATAECQTCLNTQGSAQPQAACITAGQVACAADANCMAYTTCQLACSNVGKSDGGTDATSSSDASSSDAAVSEAGSDASGACTVLADTATAFNNVSVAAAFPSPAGGTITPGTYHLTEVRTYTGPGGATGTTAGTYSQTISFTANLWTTVMTVGGQRLEVVASYSVNGTTFTPTRVCPANGSTLAATGYTATATEMTFLSLDAGNPVTRVYVLKP
jgi:hypothetical protein